TPKPAPVEEVAKTPAEKGEDASTASVAGKSDPACIGPIGPGPTETLTIGSQTFVREGHALRVQGEAEGEVEHAIGVLANLNAFHPENVFNVRRYLAHFEK